MQKPSCLFLGKNLYFINPADFSELFPRQVLENQMPKMGSLMSRIHKMQFRYKFFILKLFLCSTKTLSRGLY